MINIRQIILPISVWEDEKLMIKSEENDEIFKKNYSFEKLMK
jgi:hypothetical protein